jgi:hypothetical protein
VRASAAQQRDLEGAGTSWLIDFTAFDAELRELVEQRVAPRCHQLGMPAALMTATRVAARTPGRGKDLGY